jgi:type II secretory pathway pseudopilin PulG
LPVLLLTIKRLRVLSLLSLTVLSAEAFLQAPRLGTQRQRLQQQRQQQQQQQQHHHHQNQQPPEQQQQQQQQQQKPGGDFSACLENARRRGRTAAVAVRAGRLLLAPVVSDGKSPPRELRAWQVLLCAFALAADDTVFAVTLPVLVSDSTGEDICYSLTALNRSYTAAIYIPAAHKDPELLPPPSPSQVAVTPRNDTFPSWTPLLGASLLSLAEGIIPDV